MKFFREKLQLVKELVMYALARKNFVRLKVVVRGLDESWQADLVDMKNYAKIIKGFKYILTVMNIS